MNTYTRSSKTKYYTKEENDRFYSSLREYKQKYIFAENVLTEKSTCDIITRALLDSSLIIETNYKKYTHKIIKIGDYYQIYDYNKINLKKDSNLEKIKYQFKVRGSTEQIETNDYIKKEYEKFNNNPLYKKSRVEGELKHIDIAPKIKTKENKLKEIDIKNINRAKFEIQRLTKANIDEFKTFITLTFEENIKEIEQANKQFHSFTTYIKKLKNDFKYICVPEFQKRGAVHYHLLTNIDYTDFTLLSKEEKKLWNKSTKTWQVGRNIKGWNKGYTLAKGLAGIEVIGYITKYITKDIDNRLWGKRRYLHSRNLITPKISYIDINNIEDFKRYVDITNNSSLEYTSTYKNIYNERVDFQEYKIKLT